MKLRLKTLLAEHEAKGVAFNSKNIKPNYAFFAIKGKNFNGNDYINDALAMGASMVFTDDISKQGDKIVFVEDAREALALSAGILYPKLPKNIIAVTGTNGKSSVVSYIHQILELLGKTSAVMGTLGIESNQKLPIDYVNKKSNLTTSDPLTFRQNLHMLAEIGVDYVALEASSHGLCQKRLGDVMAHSAAFTSFSQDHLEYHETMENYLQAKLQLFSEHLLPGAKAVFNSEIEQLDVIEKFLKEKKVSYSTVGLRGDVKINKCTQSLSGQEIAFDFMDNSYEFRTDIIGSFQAINILIAAKLVHNVGVDFNKIVAVLSKIQAVAGRLQRITGVDSKHQVFVDYAHTPDALQKSLYELKELKNSSGKLYVIFGCGGDRDNTKRPIMGKIASAAADCVIITDDNPRSEEASKIRKEIIAGTNGAEEIGDRRKAIIDTIARLEKNDILLIAGKGHEDYQIIGNKVINFSDIEIAKNAL